MAPPQLEELRVFRRLSPDIHTSRIDMSANQLPLGRENDVQWCSYGTRYVLWISPKNPRRDSMGMYTLVNVYIAMEKTMCNGKIGGLWHCFTRIS